MYKVILILDKFFLKYKGRGKSNWPPPPPPGKTNLKKLFVIRVKIISKHFNANFKRLLGIELATNVIILVISSVNNDLFVYVLVTGVRCGITCVDITELNNVSYITRLPNFPRARPIKLRTLENENSIL